MSGFKRIYYEVSNNTLHHWFYDDEGKSHHEEIHPDIEYYVQDQSKKSDIKDIYGNSVILQTSENIFAMKNIAKLMKTYETDITEEVKFLQKTYCGKELKADIKNFNVCTIDIEVESEGDFPEPEEVKYPINLITVHLSKLNQTTTFGLREYTGNSDTVQNYHYCENENLLIERFIEFFRKNKPDIITGWFCIAEGEFVWLKNKILNIENVVENDILYEDNNNVQVFYNTGMKKNNKIILDNGYEINCSEDHIFPVYFKEKNKYKNSNSILKNYKDENVKNIKEHLKNKDYFVKILIGNNSNKPYTYRQLINDNLEKILKYDCIDIIKLSGKVRPFNYLETSFNAYKSGKYDRNLLDLLDSVSIFNEKYYMFNDQFPKNFFDYTNNCDKNCQTCKYCYQLDIVVRVRLQ
jgi:hypothetical protein